MQRPRVKTSACIMLRGEEREMILRNLSEGLGKMQEFFPAVRQSAKQKCFKKAACACRRCNGEKYLVY